MGTGGACLSAVTRRGLPGAWVSLSCLVSRDLGEVKVSSMRGLPPESPCQTGIDFSLKVRGGREGRPLFLPRRTIFVVPMGFIMAVSVEIILCLNGNYLFELFSVIKKSHPPL